ncbi:hypothetical protein KDA_55790 [Dictyobacter alpinus]|uniref:VOC domain-containing protein n=1 Tax=Dictyobacter alpinus TaxID=2014873 RepID=A0A402BFC6_9CHLR|nr:VOC family protein [Dictyobacter alpinus]GCE30095.1 hypothetical protein KDA_55790 [Dictyobacter alpinus]
MEQTVNRTTYPTIIPYLIAQDADALLDFVKQVFGATELFRTIGNAGGTHAEVRIGDSIVMIGGGGEGKKWSGEAVTAALYLSIDEVKETYERAMKAGSTSLQEPTEVPKRGYSADFNDPFGNTWFLSRREQGERVAGAKESE